jgi:hypothetical protein
VFTIIRLLPGRGRGQSRSDLAVPRRCPRLDLCSVPMVWAYFPQRSHRGKRWIQVLTSMPNVPTKPNRSIQSLFVGTKIFSTTKDNEPAHCPAAPNQSARWNTRIRVQMVCNDSRILLTSVLERRGIGKGMVDVVKHGLGSFVFRG